MSRVTLNDLIIPKYDDLLNDILDFKHVHYILYGGRGSSKSSFIAIAIILLMIDPKNSDMHAVIFRKIANTLRDSVYAQISFAISLLGLDALFKKTISPMEITYIKTGQKILFRGLDQPEKIKSIKAPFGYFGITHFEELDQYHGREEIRTVLQSTMRGKGGRFINFESFNPPISAMNWANKDLLTERPDRLCVQTSYLDVPRDWLSEQFFEEADFLKEINPRAYEHEYLGVPIGAGGNVFENVRHEEITDEKIRSFDRILNGVDWGYYPDPWAFVRVQFQPAQRILYIFDEAVENKKGNRETAEIIKKKGLTYADRITCDSAEPKSVADYREYGLHSFSAEKGPGSVEYSHKWLQSLNAIIIDRKRCPKAYAEFTEYEYERDKNNDVISGYPDRDNHLIDAVRYATEMLWARRETPRKSLV